MPFGALLANGSLSYFGTLTLCTLWIHGSLSINGTLRQDGSLFICGTLMLNGSLIDLGALRVVGSLA